MNITKYLQAARVPENLWEDAQKSMEGGKKSAKGLLWHKFKVRMFKAGKIAKAMPWSAERYLDVNPGSRDDVAPMISITGHGDNAPWVMTVYGGRPFPGQWLNPDPESEEYKKAVESNYWCPGTHPRSEESRKAWYRRNGGEYLAWERGWPVDTVGWSGPWQSSDGKIVVRQNNGAWEINAIDKWLGIIPFKVRIGYEINNVLSFAGIQLWYPIEGHELRAPVTWSVIPFRK